ncbi:MAG: sugar-binding transcriptional regulator, partial [Coprobacillaceae bacterium]
MKEEKRKILSQVAYMHFVEGKSQSIIAEELGIYRTTISRMIKQAREEGVVEIQIKDFDSKIYALESYIKEMYGLQYINIVPTEYKQSEVDKNQNLAKQAADFLKQKIEANQVVGVSWGSTLGNTIANIESKKITSSTFVPIAGGPSHINSKYHVNTLVYELARKFGGESVFINATVIQESKRLRDGILNSKYFEQLKQHWNQLDVAIVGIGGSLYMKDSQWRDLLTDEDYEDLKLREAVGDCCCRFFDKEGHV